MAHLIEHTFSASFWVAIIHDMVQSWHVFYSSLSSDDELSLCTGARNFWSSMTLEVETCSFPTGGESGDGLGVASKIWGGCLNCLEFSGWNMPALFAGRVLTLKDTKSLLIHKCDKQTAIWAATNLDCFSRS